MSSPSRLTQMTIDVGDEQVVLERLEGRETLGKPFSFAARIISPLEIDLQPHLGKPAMVSVYEDEVLLRHFHGLIVAGAYDKETNSGHHYELTLQPWTFFLAQNRQMAIFQNLTAVDIIKQVFETAGVSDVDYTRLSRARVQRMYCVQYKESDFAFVSRLMEEEGIYYFFRHDTDRHVMVLCEGSKSHVPGTPPKLDYNPNSVSVFSTDSANRFNRAANFLQSWSERVTTAARSRVTVRDFDFESPDQPLSAEFAAEGAHPRDDREVFVYPGRYTREKTGRGDQEKTGQERGQTALEGYRANQRSFAGTSQASGLSCGALVNVAGHPAGRMNGSHLITSTFHSIAAENYRSGASDDEDPFNVRFEAIPADTNYQSAQDTPRPVVQGLESAIVTGPAGETIYTDEYGRVKVRFHWDRKGEPGEKTTCWIRVSQTGGLGNVILPRVGHEVLVDFLNGDPDRPVVVGRVFNRSHMPIYDLPANKTRAVWRTLRYGETGAYPNAQPLDSGTPSSNEIRFEDKGGSEELYVHAERDMNSRVRLDESRHVGRTRSTRIGYDEIKHVTNDQTTTIVQHRKADVGQSDYLHVGTTLLIEAETSITLRVKGSSIVIDPTGITVHGPAVTVKGNQKIDATAPLTTIKGTATLVLDGKLTRIN